MTNGAYSVGGLLAEIDSFKSQSVRKFNKNIFIYWHAGLADAPDITRLAVLMAKTLNDQYNIIFLDEDNLAGFFPYREALLANTTIDPQQAHFSDVLRSYLICKYGGIWMDASCLVTQNFATWLEPVLESSDYFLWKNEVFTDRLIMSWFLAGKTNAAMLARVLELLVLYITEPRNGRLALTFNPEKFCTAELIGPRETDLRAIRAIETTGHYPYFIYHYLWNEAAKENIQFSESLEKLPDIPIHVKKFDRRKFTETSFFVRTENKFSVCAEKIQADETFYPWIKNRILEVLSPPICHVVKSDA